MFLTSVFCFGVFVLALSLVATIEMFHESRPGSIKRQFAFVMASLFCCLLSTCTFAALEGTKMFTTVSVEFRSGLRLLIFVPAFVTVLALYKYMVKLDRVLGESNGNGGPRA